MQVVALTTGFFGGLRREGDTFDVPDGSMGSWFKPTAPAPATQAEPDKPKRPRKPDPADEPLA